VSRTTAAIGVVRQSLQRKIVGGLLDRIYPLENDGVVDEAAVW